MSQHSDFPGRPDSEMLTDLAVYVVPPELWRENLHSAVTDKEAISAGFLRVHPETPVTALREEIEIQLSEEFEIPQTYVFLKNLGKCLTKVRHKQETTLKVKHFIAPGPSSFVPEIYLLEGGSDTMSIHPSSVSSYRSDAPREDPYQLNSYRGKRFSNQKAIPPIHSGTDDSETLTNPNTDLSHVQNHPLTTSSESLQSQYVIKSHEKNTHTDSSSSLNSTRSIHSKHPSQYVIKSHDKNNQNTHTDSSSSLNSTRSIHSKHPLVPDISTSSQGLKSVSFNVAHREVEGEVLDDVRFHRIPTPGAEYPNANDKAVQFTGFDDKAVQATPGINTPPDDKQGNSPVCMSDNINDKAIQTEYILTSQVNKNNNNNILNNNNNNTYSNHGNSAPSVHSQNKSYTSGNSYNEHRNTNNTTTGRQQPQQNGYMPPLSATPPHSPPPRMSTRDHEPLPPLSATPPIVGDESFKMSNGNAASNDHASRWEAPSPIRPDSSLRRQAEEDERRRREEEERRRREAEERRREEEERRRREEEERKRREEEERRRRREEEERKRREEEEREKSRQNDLDGDRLSREEEERRRRLESEERKRREEEERRRLESEERKRREAEDEEERRRRLEEEEEERSRRLEEEERRRRLDEEERARREEELNQKSDDEDEESKQTLIDELSRLRQERKETELQREELVKRAKQLQSKTQSKRNQARDIWKKKYFEEKKKSPPLEDQCTKLRQELEGLHKRIVNTMEGGGNTNRGGKGGSLDKPSPQSNVKIQAARLQHEIEDLQRRVETVKMKLTAEMKLRNQAEVELRALRAELTQKKINVTLARSKQQQQPPPTQGTPRGQLAPLTSRT